MRNRDLIGADLQASYMYVQGLLSSDGVPQRFVVCGDFTWDGCTSIELWVRFYVKDISNAVS